MTRQEIEALAQTMLKEHGLANWTVRAVYEQDDMGDEDDIAGSHGRAFHEERLIWLNMRYADDTRLVREILLHEIAHALLGQRVGDQHDEEFRLKLREIGGSLGTSESEAQESIENDGRNSKRRRLRAQVDPGPPHHRAACLKVPGLPSDER
jgi:SprT-like family